MTGRNFTDTAIRRLSMAAALALVVANAEMRFLWLAIASALLVGTVVISRRQLQTELALRDVVPSASPQMSDGARCGDRHG